MNAIVPIRSMGASCYDCENGYSGRNGLMCEVTRDFVFDEKTAETCEMFEPGDTNDAA